MKSPKTLLNVFVALIVMTVASLAPVNSFSQNLQVPTKKELATLLKTANEPPDHVRIAAYYKQEASRLRQSAKEHAALATIYQESHPFAALEAKHGNTFGQGASHCKKFADLALEEAKEADALAALHENMAEAAAKKQ